MHKEKTRGAGSPGKHSLIPPSHLEPKVAFLFLLRSLCRFLLPGKGLWLTSHLWSLPYSKSPWYFCPDFVTCCLDFFFNLLAGLYQGTPALRSLLPCASLSSGPLVVEIIHNSQIKTSFGSFEKRGEKKKLETLELEGTSRMSLTILLQKQTETWNEEVTWQGDKLHGMGQRDREGPGGPRKGKGSIAGA